MNCLNCQIPLDGKYCKNCGQKTNTKRLSPKHFVEHDLIHGVLHLDRGLPRTLKEIFLRPGGVAQDYIKGRRKKYYNFFYLLLLIVGAYLFLRSFEINPSEVVKSVAEENSSSKKPIELGPFFKKNTKFIIFLYIPILALAGSLIFRKLKLNLLEWSIPAVISVIGSNLFNLVVKGSNIIQEIAGVSHENIFFRIFELIFLLSVFLFPLVTFAQFIKGNYSSLGKVWRLLTFYLLALLIMTILLATLMFIKGQGLDANTYTF